MELSELRRHWGGKTYEFYNRHGAYGSARRPKPWPLRTRKNSGAMGFWPE